MSSKKSAAIGFIFITMLIDIIGIGIIIPVIPKLLQELNHSDISEAAKLGGWLAFAYAFTQFLFAPFMGSLSDRFGRRPVLLTSRSEEHTSELQSRPHLVCRLLLE